MNEDFPSVRQLGEKCCLNVMVGKAEVSKRSEFCVTSCIEGSPGEAEKSQRINLSLELILESDFPKCPEISSPVCPCVQLILL